MTCLCLQASDEHQQELQKVKAEMEEARDLLHKAQEERDEARSDERLVKLQLDKIMKIWAKTVEESEQLKIKCKEVGKNQARKTVTGVSLSEDSGSPSLPEGPPDSPGSKKYCDCKTSSKAHPELGVKMMDLEQVGRNPAHQYKHLLWGKGRLSCCSSHRLMVSVCLQAADVGFQMKDLGGTQVRR